MGLDRARAQAMLVLAAIIAAVMVAGVGGAASATPRPAPSVSYRQSGDQSVTVVGRTVGAAARVRFEARRGSAWIAASRTRAHRHRYSTTLQVAPGTSTTFRVTSDHRSRTFVVRMPAALRPTSYDACGARPRKADGTLWSCTFDDEFDGNALDRTRWVPQTEFVTGDKDAGYACYLDDPDNVAVGNGMLSLTVRAETRPVPCGSSSTTAQYSAGFISTYHLFSQQYGRFEARVRNTASAVAGLHEAFWLWPDDRVPSSVAWPDAGEIDVSETYSLHNTLSIPFLHYSADAGGPQNGVNTAWSCTAYRGTWNTYTLEWTAKTLRLLVNGQTCLTNTSGDPAFQKPYIVALTQALGQGNNKMSGSTPLPATMNVDYVRVWQ